MRPLWYDGCTWPPPNRSSALVGHRSQVTGERDLTSDNLCWWTPPPPATHTAVTSRPKLCFMDALAGRCTCRSPRRPRAAAERNVCNSRPPWRSVARLPHLPSADGPQAGHDNRRRARPAPRDTCAPWQRRRKPRVRAPELTEGETVAGQRAQTTACFNRLCMRTPLPPPKCVPRARFCHLWRVPKTLVRDAPQPVAVPTLRARASAPFRRPFRCRHGRTYARSHRFGVCA